MCVFLWAVACHSTAFGQVADLHENPLISNIDVRNDILSQDSGNNHFDRAFGRVIIHMANTFGVFPAIGYIKKPKTKDAVASEIIRDISYPDGTIALGQELVELSMNSNNDTVLVWVSAHEFSHIFQNRNNLRHFFQNRCVPFAIELHADYLAGWYLTKYKRWVTASNLYSAGDYISRSGSTSYTSPGTHGFSRQRTEASEKGFEFGTQHSGSDISSASEAGIVYLRNFSHCSTN